MKKKVKITVTATREIELDPDLYYEGITDEEMLQEEIKFADNLFYEWADSEDVQWVTEGKFVE